MRDGLPAAAPARLLTPPCCDEGRGREVAGAPTVVLVGNPNVGKSTLFNALTGARQAVGNWPGKTVRVARGTWDAAPGPAVTLIDLPGTYSLEPRSPDEELTRDLLCGAERRPGLVVAVVDAANLARNLYLLAQVLEAGLPVVVALTMADVAASRGLRVDPGRLSAELGVPVVPVVPRRREGVDDLAAAVADALRDPVVPSPPPLGEQAEQAVAALLPACAATPWPPRLLATALLGGGADVPGVPEELRERAARQGELLLASGAADDEYGGVPALLAEGRYAWAHRVLSASAERRGAAPSWSDRADRVLTSRLFGVPAFLLAMWGVFAATTTFVAPVQDLLGRLFDGPLSGSARDLLAALGAPPWLTGLAVDGLIGGVGQLLTFVPLMLVMFVLLTLLEDSGYMARAAFVADRLMRLVGLPGRAFLPIIVGFGCNVPALSATRILGHPGQRLLLGLLMPYVSCTARLTVYVLLATVFFGRAGGTVVFGMYLLSVTLVVTMGLVLRRTLFRDLAQESLLLELPPYRMPSARVVAVRTWQKLSGFLRTAGTVIVGTVAAVWLLAAVPVGVEAEFGQAPVEHSALGAVSDALAPVFEPLGFGDWHAVAALSTGFVAKEAVVATMAQTYGSQEPKDSSRPGTLAPALRDTFEATSGGHPVAAVLAFMVFLLAYTPCMATLAAQWQEIGPRFTLIGLVTQLSVAWLLALAVFRVGRIFL
ncbi:ferrous iron transport protein B [Nonomuraea pusilla]|uniref:Ferrous iron transport protein B n=1 Tax=Nonomuraea pusilla TaxID=46177 RepID=A0A1H7IV05_9ACTN|nr:ferrous iron transport protein B [Nonomuraea pusilla]SEK65480.1 ferrous iron transport protein B [Nonomuraea pusilla]